MVVKIYISGISGNKEVKKRQQRVLMILDSKNVEYETIDITEPGKEMEKEFMQANSIARESKYPLPPQIFNEEEYCGDYEDFDLANEIDELEEFLKVAPPVSAKENVLDLNQSKEIQENGNTTSREPSTDKEATAVEAESVEKRTTLPSENVQSDESKSIEHDGGTNTEESAEHTEENVEKNEEKSDDQEKEE
ncbi:LOW QUALITY PROTEIN: SH3 domain-binding glutamic acid-rich protein homolog [Apis florea]|uniref:LOW QUALITY PROTEIN: SH3 domain-binding glutamic acid-rich protein homolog n=1 Tax=Apis florea TaxID=7463 RepID=UPI00062951D9|nr:LOW QUALITY PROTEIN: SH3 domain-binding glutamic acid-rich protein homolog [Apis florea]